MLSLVLREVHMSVRVGWGGKECRVVGMVSSPAFWMPKMDLTDWGAWWRGASGVGISY